MGDPITTSLIIGGATAGAGALMGPGKQKPDPGLVAQEQQAQQDNVKALQVQMEGDTSSLLARYGQRLALANATGAAPTVAPMSGTIRG